MHEAGHAIVGLQLSVAEIEVIIVAREVGHRDGSFGHVHWRRKVRRSRSRQSYLDEIAMMLGCMAAEKVILGDIFDGSGGVKGSDLQRASDLATLMLANLGLGALHYCDVTTTKELDELRRKDSSLRQRVQNLLAVELQRAVAIVDRRKQEVEWLANAVAERELLSGRDVAAVIEPLGKTGR